MVAPLRAALAAALLFLAVPDARAAAVPADSAAPATVPAPVMPLLVDPADMGLGASVYFAHVPTPGEIGDLEYVRNVQHVVLVLPAWPRGYDRLQPLEQAAFPEGADLIVVLPGYPPTRETAEAWNLLRRPARIILHVDGPPADRGTIDTLNRMRALERVIADMAEPARSGFERLQRPLAFRVVRP